MIFKFLHYKSREDYMNHFQVQQIAKNTMEYLKTQICVGQSLLEIRNICESKMLELGADSFWYYDIGAFVFSGDETAVSVSGREYKTSDRIIRENDIITVDLSPQCRHIWGDYARTIVIENGRVAEDINDICNDEWRNGLIFENQLHNALYKIVNKDTTFEDLYFNINDLIEKSGYINLDFNGNLGHTINRHKFRRTYIEKGNKKKISCADYFTFEPHISIPNSKFGFKKENIYIFKNNELVLL